MVDAFDRRSAAKDVAEVVIHQELERAERAATQRIRDRIHDSPPERRLKPTWKPWQISTLTSTARWVRRRSLLTWG